MKNLIYTLLLFIIPSCVNFTNIQSARTLGPTKEKDFYIYTRLTVPEVSGEVEGVFLVPEFVYKKRLKNNIDWGFKVAIDTKISGNIKYQFIGNSKSKFAVSLVPEVGLSYFPSKDGGVHNIPLSFQSEIPLLVTYHFTNYTFITTAPKIVDYYTPRGNYGMFAWSTGLQFGKKVNWTLAYSYFKIFDSPNDEQTSNGPSSSFFNQANVFEVGIKFNLRVGGRMHIPSI